MKTTWPRFSTAALLALGAPAPAVHAADQAASRAATAGSSAEVIEQITVTARRREESLYDVPVAVTALSGADIEARGIQTVSDTFGEIPSLFFTTSGAPISDASTSFLVMRGVGATYVADPAVGIFVDGVYQPTISFGQEILAVERVEVLRGPQGTQFGRNTQGGAVNFVTRRPSLEPQARLTAEADQYRKLNASLYTSGGLAESLSGNLALLTTSSDGYIHNTYTGKDQLESSGVKGRGGLLWSGDGGWQAYATAFYEERRGPGMSLGVLQGCECYDVDLDIDRDNTFRSYGANVELTIPVGDVRVRSLTGYSRANADALEDVDGTSLFQGNVDRTIQTQRFASQELRLESAAGARLGWMTGLYFEESRRALTVDRRWPDFIGYATLFDDTVIFAAGSVDTTAYAAYGDVNYAFSDRWELAAGARFAREKAQRGGGGFLLIPGLGGIVGSATSDRAERDYDTFTPRVSLSFHPTKDQTLYGSVSTGSKAGGFSAFPGLNQLDNSFDAEKSLAYELGMKGLFFDYRLSFAGALFLTEIQDQQVEVAVFIDGLPRSVFDNAAESETRGAELEVAYQITDQWKLNLTASYTDAEYKKYVDSNGVDRDGQRFPFLPKWLGSAGLTYKRPVSDSLTFVGALDGRYIGEQISDPALTSASDNAYLPIPSSTVIDARMGIETDRLRVYGYVSNIADRYYITHASFAKFTFGTPPYNQRTYENPGAPRTIGVRFEWTL